MICEYFLPVCALSVHTLPGIFQTTFLILKRSNLDFFPPFGFCAFDVMSKKQLLNTRSQIFTPTVYSKSFISSVVAFELAFYIWYKAENLTSLFCMSVYPIVPEKLLKRLFFIEFLVKNELMNIGRICCTFGSIPLL